MTGRSVWRTRERRYLGVGDQLTGLGIGDRAGVVDRDPGVVGNGCIAVATARFFTSTTENRTPARWQARATVL